jgi:hypothetical protein
MLLEADMLRNLWSIGDGVTRQHSAYFTKPVGVTNRTRFREDIRAIVGGALAAAFLAAAFAGWVPNSFMSDGTMAAIAAVFGGVAGKVFLV